MGYEVVIIGENIDTSHYNPDNLILRPNKCLVSFDTKNQATTEIDKINKTGKNRAFLYSEIQKNEPLLKDDILEEINYEEMINHQFTGNEEFIVLNDGILSLWDINNTEVYGNTQKKGILGKIEVSNTGAFLVNFEGKKVEIYIKDFSVLFYRMWSESSVEKCEFSKDDMFLIAYSEKKIHIFNLLRPNEENIIDDFINTFDRENVYLIDHCLYFLDSKKVYNLRDKIFVEYPKDLIKVSASGTQSFYFYSGKSQMIKYKSEKSTSKKTQANIKDVNFGFTTKLAYAYITKKIKDKILYNLEIYINDMIFFINLDSKPVDFKISSKMIIILDSKNNITIYKRRTGTYTKTKEIKKEGEVLISLSKNIVCLWDEVSENLEFYDDMNLRSVYLHSNCTNLEWSESGIYLAAFSKVSGVLQIFTNNGKLIFKKVYNVFSDFKWRKYLLIGEDEKELIKEYDVEEYKKRLEVKSKGEYDLESMISQWKSFLVSKKALISQ
ncbi:eukaryotic translation initiation factor 3 subunit B [Vairimorpha necatrix]|uniref:Eukaryotic translation initiation factor 3 subunit B n=1 Tax=Vairimorpha necatrix TaxID=6039 RepID=A0AAX4JC71_9MICR